MGMTNCNAQVHMSMSPCSHMNSSTVQTQIHRNKDALIDTIQEAFGQALGSLVLRLSAGEGEGRAWYPLRVHRLNFPSFWGNSHSLCSLSCNSDVIIIVTVGAV